MIPNEAKSQFHEIITYEMFEMDRTTRRRTSGDAIEHDFSGLGDIRTSDAGPHPGRNEFPQPIYSGATPSMPDGAPCHTHLGNGCRGFSAGARPRPGSQRSSATTVSGRLGSRPISRTAVRSRRQRRWLIMHRRARSPARRAQPR